MTNNNAVVEKNIGKQKTPTRCFPQALSGGNSRGRSIIRFGFSANTANPTKTMKCEDLQLNLSLYADDDLSPDDQTVIDEHLVHCPTCRVKLSEYQSMRNDLRSLSRPGVPSDLVYSMRSAVAAELNPRQSRNFFNLSSELSEWLQFRLMPIGVGTAFSLLMAFSFVFSLGSTKESADQVIENARINSNRIPAPSKPKSNDPMDLPNLTNEELAALRTPVSGESPSLNTNGALLSLTKSLVRGQMKDDEVTFVADVLSNGMAEITEVVHAPKSHQELEDLSNALENDDRYAPFVSAELDNRSDKVRVVIKIQRVDVFETEPKSKKRPKK